MRNKQLQLAAGEGVSLVTGWCVVNYWGEVSSVKRGVSIDGAYIYYSVMYAEAINYYIYKNGIA